MKTPNDWEKLMHMFILIVTLYRNSYLSRNPSNGGESTCLGAGGKGVICFGHIELLTMVQNLICKIRKVRILIMRNIFRKAS